MRRKLAAAGTPQPAHRGLSSVACLAFVLFLALAFWAGAAWLVELLLQRGATG